MTGRHTRTFTHMGGEGAPFVGLSSFTDVKHMFANLGDGTYQHSGSLAIRQAVAAKTRITYKLLFNDAVAMTGGQPAEGAPTVPMIAAQLAAEGVKRIAIVADEADRLPPASALPPGVTRHTRDELDAVQTSLRDFEGPSVLIYDQVCATEKRRRRKRGSMAQPTRHVVINEAVCENCGDCSTQSGCIAIEPVETELGRKRRINPTSCNVDLSCLKGFCPSFVTQAGPPAAPDADTAVAGCARLSWRSALPPPVLPAPEVWRGLFAGIGGGGIVTSGAILAMAAHLEGRAVKTLDFTGLAQKNGAVVAHVQIAADEAALDVVRIPLGTRGPDAGGRPRGRLPGRRAGAERQDRRGDRQPGPGRDGRFQAQRGAVDRCRAASAHDREGDGRQALALAARRAAGGAAVRQRPGDEHDAAGHGVAARAGAGGRGRDPARDRAERRGGEAEQAGFPVGAHPGGSAGSDEADPGRRGERAAGRP